MDEPDDTYSSSSKKCWYILQERHLDNGAKYGSVLACSSEALIHELCLARPSRAVAKPVQLTLGKVTKGKSI